ncbi:MAG: hypothetical protein GY757_12390 [bacterium]|nr:hypothetical protein [bacterium]
MKKNPAIMITPTVNCREPVHIIPSQDSPSTSTPLKTQLTAAVIVLIFALLAALSLTPALESGTKFKKDDLPKTKILLTKTNLKSHNIKPQ